MVRIFIVLAVVFLMSFSGSVSANDVVVPAAGAETEDALPDWRGFLLARSGGTWNADKGEVIPYITVPILGYKDKFTLEGRTEIDIDKDTEAKGPTSAILGLTYNLGDLQRYGVDVSWAKYFSFNIGPCMRYDFTTGEVDFTLMLSAVDLSFDQGNVDRQKAAKK